ncbi:MAG: YdiU family protein [Verrucomicrobiota bacterium]
MPFDNTYASLPKGFSIRVDPSPVPKPRLLRFNQSLADDLLLDLDPDSPETVAVLAGNKVPVGADPLAMAYSGHQFGGFSPQLGDGRAILLGEVINQSGARRDIQLKGAGPTPFSRRGDGRSALGPVVREYILSEAMAALGIPTTRALAAVASGEDVYRESMVPGGVFTRVASSHIRIGTFQWFSARQDQENLRVLADYVIQRHYPEALESDQPYLTLLQSVIKRQAELIAQWISFGFIHGVMNTDNMTLSGETIDYGPCAFLDTYHPDKVFSSIDQHGRYSFNNQAPIALWNLTRLAETLIPLLHQSPEEAVPLAEESLESFIQHHETALTRRLTAKIGLSPERPEAFPQVQSLLALMTKGQADFTLTFRHLSAAMDESGAAPFLEQFDSGLKDDLHAWLTDWRSLLPAKGSEMMATSNPIYIPRNHRIEEAIQAAYQDNDHPFHTLNDLLQAPFAEQRGMAAYESAPSPEEVVTATFCGT